MQARDSARREALRDGSSRSNQTGHHGEASADFPKAESPSAESPLRDNAAQDTHASQATQIEAIHKALAEKLGEQTYRIWFKNSATFSLVFPESGGAREYLKISVPNLFVANWVENHFLHQIQQAVLAATGRNLKVTFAVDAGHSADSFRSSVLREPIERQPDGTSKVGGYVPSAGADRCLPTAKRKTGKRLELTLGTFVVGPSNELAYNAAKQIAREQRSPFNPLFVHGGYGLGKTHLLQGMCNEVSAKRPTCNWLYLSAEEFANRFVLALKTKKLETFRQKMRQTDLLAIDDIHFLANKPSTQEEFLHTFNTINLAGKQIILASDAHPKMIGQLSEKLVSRFISGMVVKIEAPDFQTRCQICRQYAARVYGKSALSVRDTSVASRKDAPRSHVSESVIRYIAENLRSSIRELEGALLKVIAYSELQNEKITLPMAQSVLAEHLERCDPIVHVCDIESAVATYFGVTPTNIHSSKKNKTVSLARHFSMYLARKLTKMSSCEIGRFMGNKNHATVLLACKNIEDMIRQNAQVQWNGPTGNRVAKTKTILAHLEQTISA